MYIEQGQIRAARAVAGVALELHRHDVAAVHQINIDKRTSMAQVQDALRCAGIIQPHHRKQLNRSAKRALACESPRRWTWERREKLLLLATLADACCLSLLVTALADRRAAVLRLGCHRTGNRSRETPTALYRLWAALSQSCPLRRVHG